jgi:hypothetical protein
VPGPGPRPVAPEEPRPGRRRRPDEVEVADGAGPDAHAALLHGVERDLLAQFQAELGERERRPRPYRRAGQNGRSGPNGSGRNGSQQNGSHQDGSAHNGSAHNGRTVNGHGSDDDRPPPDLAG